MARGQVLTIPDAHALLITTESREEKASIAVLNPNDGVLYIKINGPASPQIAQWDWKLPSQSYGLFPGPWGSIGIWYADQSGARSGGEINVYDNDNRLVVPIINAIGRAVQIGTSSAMDIQQGNIPSNPPGGFTRLWSDLSGKVYRLLTGGDNAELATKDTNGKIPIADIPVLPYVNETGDSMSGDLYAPNILGSGSISGNTAQGDYTAFAANGRLGAVSAADYNGGHVSIQAQDGTAGRISFHMHGIIGHTLYQTNTHDRPFRVISNAGTDVELLTDIGTQTLSNKNIKWRYEVNTNGTLTQYFCFYILNVPGGVWTLPASSGHAGEMIICKSWMSSNGTLAAPGGSVLGTIPGGVTSLVIRPGDSYTFMSDGGAGWMVV